ncbi:lipopolysaccharide biosynthesis protein [Virgibacillus oceani]
MLTSGVVLAQIITFLCQPIITRLYSPEDFGGLSLITSLVNMLVPLLTLQYQMAIITAKSDKEANAVSALTFYILAFMLFLISLGIISYNYFNPNTFKEVGNWIYVALPLLLLSGFAKIADAYNNRFEQYKLMSSIALIRSISSNTLKITLGIFKVGFLGLIISQFVATIFGIRKQSQYIIAKKKEIFNSTRLELKNVLNKYRVQPLFSMPGLFATVVSFSILPILITSLYNIEETGYFYLTMSVLAIPMSLVSSNVAKVFFRKATIEKEEKGNFYSTFISTAILLIVISIIGFLLLWFFAEPLFSIVYGEEWMRSGTFVKILIPLFAIRFVVTGLMHGFIISGKQLVKLTLQLLFIVIALVIYFIVKNQNLSIEEFLELINIGYFILYSILFIVLYLTSKNKI